VSSAQAAFPIVFYDGLCGFCDRSVQFLLSHGGHERFRFAALQGATAAALLDEQTRVKLDSLVLRTVDGRIYKRSTAAIKIAGGLGGVWVLALLLLLVPRRVRDFFYDQFARRRYRWFGQLDQCRLPTPGERAAFLD
jgi:predicted DCC family thiol-disulfide oxidoreductase YuxK